MILQALSHRLDLHRWGYRSVTSGLMVYLDAVVLNDHCIHLVQSLNFSKLKSDL